MPAEESKPPPRQMAVSTWDNEGGAEARDSPPSATAQSDVPALTNAELVQLRIRVIALENLLIALLAEASDRQLGLAREMAAYIAPRPGFTAHRLTIQASARMIDLVDRAGHFQSLTPT